jgi:hypothetical protein
VIVRHGIPEHDAFVPRRVVNLEARGLEHGEGYRTVYRFARRFGARLRRVLDFSKDGRAD